MTMRSLAAFVILLPLLAGTCRAGTELLGVPRSKMGLYNPSKPFNCLDGSGTVAWTKVNDDYCDCRDGSDEPGTSACPNGKFFCPNPGHKAQYLLSSRVNDGVCDCCDGSDEYNSWVQCANVCWEEGKAARAEAERMREQLIEGNKVYTELIRGVEEKLANRRKRLSEIDNEIDGLKPQKEQLEAAKKSAEDAESAAKDSHKKSWEEMRERERAEKVFNELDADSDGKITLADMQLHSEFDVNSDGGVTHDELKQYTEGLEEADFATFQEKVWPNIKTVYKSAKRPAAASDADNTDKEMDDALGDAEKPKADEEQDADKQESEEKMPDYPAEVQELIDKASSARDEFNKVSDQATQLANEKANLERMVDRDYGPASAFFPLADSGECSELSDNEYTYRLCPFKEAVQVQKQSGSSTSLGNFKDWSGPADDKYSQQEYTDGQSCWNGPNRSTKVQIVCGAKNELLSASEPSRCEYAMQFATPAACSADPSEAAHDAEHEEL